MAPSLLAAASPFVLHGAAGSSSSRRPLTAATSRRAVLRVAALKYEPSKVAPQADRVLVRLEQIPEKSAGGVLLPKSAVKFERYLMGEILSVGADVSEVKAGKKVIFSDINAYEVDLGSDDKHCFCRELAAGQLKALDGLQELCRWIEDRNLKRAAVTNAPRANAELVLSLLGLTEFFPVLVIGSECGRAKPFPDPYLKALQLIGASPEHTFIFEDSASGIRAGVAAGMPVVGLTTGNPEKVLRDAGARLLIKDFQDPKLLAMLEELEAAAPRVQS